MSSNKFKKKQVLILVDIQNKGEFVRKKISKITFFFCFLIVLFLTLGIFILNGLSEGCVFALSGNGGAIYVDSNSNVTIIDSIISGNNATDGGGVFVAKNGKFYLGKYSVNDIIEFGSYPKTYQSDTSVITTIQDENGYYLGTDGEKYAKVSANPYNSSYVFNDGTTIIKGTEYYFKVEPIKWRVLSIENGKALLLCEDIIDAHKYNYTNSDRTINGSTIYANNYKYSDIRAWLNGYSQESGNVSGEDWSTGGFLQTAFTEEEQNLILTTEVDNSASTTSSSSNAYVCENTNDKIFLMSYKQMLKSDLGFEILFSKNDRERMRQTTDFARANNAYYNTSSSYLYNGYYWLRSPNASYSYYTDFVYYNGGSDRGNVSVSYLGVVPAMVIDAKYPKISGNTATNGGGVFVAGDFIMNDGEISNNTAENGGGVDLGFGSFTMNGGTICSNKNTSTTNSDKGYNLYTAGTFTMNGGTIGAKGSSQTGYGIYSWMGDSMHFYGGTVYDNIYSSCPAPIYLKKKANIVGSITLDKEARIILKDYSGTTPKYKIILASSWSAETIITLQGSKTAPDVSKMSISGYDTDLYNLEAIQGSSEDEWKVVLKKNIHSC